MMASNTGAGAPSQKQEQQQQQKQEPQQEQQQQQEQPTPQKDKTIVSTVPPKEPTKPKRSSGGKSVASYRFSEEIRSSRPVNVYIENIQGTNVVWYTTEDGKEVGRKAATRRDDLTKMDVILGYDYSIRATREEIDKIMSIAYVRTQVYMKDGTHRSLLTPESAKNIQL